MNAQELLLADLDHFGAAFLKNEEIGEKRFEFFTTLAAAVIGGIAALAKGDLPFGAEISGNVAAALLTGLLIFGMLTYIRMLQRNRTTDDYKRTLTYIRNTYRSECGDTLPRYQVPQRAHSWTRRWLRAGYAETTGVVNGLILTTLLVALDRDPTGAALAGAAVAIGLWILAGTRSVEAMAKTPAVYFRAGVGAIILNGEGLALAVERRDVPRAWQCPQGGIEIGESPRAAVLREIAEETGIHSRNIEWIADYPTWLAYVLPTAQQTAKTGFGQVQLWSVFRCRKPLKLKLPDEGETLNAEWISFERIADGIVEFRRPVYESLRAFVRQYAVK